MEGAIPLEMLKTLNPGDLVVENGTHQLYYGSLTQSIDVI